MCLLSQYCEPFRNFQLDYQWVTVFPVLLLMGTMATAMCVPAASKFPLDMLLLFVFILSFSYLISFSCSIVADEIPGPTVVIAIGTTVAITIALTLYAFFCKVNYALLCGIIIVVSITMFMVFMVAIFTFAPIMISIYCGLAVIIYGIYLVFITKMIIGNENMDGFPMDNYILASLFLYIYIIKMFLMILRIVANSRR
jgi:FtsH-binding integral membrane protein